MKILTTILLIFISLVSFTQVYQINAYNGQTVTTCSGTFYDSGGSGGSYNGSENYSVTFCSGTGENIGLIFSSITVESGFDNIYIYDGPNSSYPQVPGSPFSGSYSGVNAVSTNTCITVVFQSDGSINQAGWVATIDCGIEPPEPTVQDCLGAIPICQSYYVEPDPYAYSGNGTYQDEIGVAPAGCIPLEDNGVWYIFSAQTNGVFRFALTPHNSYDDYDWAVFNLTNSDCSVITTNPTSIVVSSNTAGNDGSSPPVNHGPTGANSSNAASSGNCHGPGVGSWNQWNSDIPVTAGSTYVLYVSNWSGSNYGYDIDFSGSTAVIFDDIPPELIAVNQPACEATSLTFHFSELVYCETVSAADFVLSGPGGPFTITGLNSPDCASGSEFGSTYTISFSPAITYSGTYTLTLNASLAGSVADICGNLAPTRNIPFEMDCYCETPATTVSIIPPACHNDLAVVQYNGAATGSVVYNWDFGTATVASGNTSTGGPISLSFPSTNQTYNFSLEVIMESCEPSSGNFNVFVPSEITYSIDTTSDFCEQCIGNAQVSVSGGTPPYTYSWNTSPPQSTPNASDLCPGSYLLSFSDANGCEINQNVVIENIPGFELEATPTHLSCYGDDNGAISLSITGGNPPFSYSWSNGQSSQNISGLQAGNYTVTVVASDGCTDDLEITINQPAEIILNLQFDNVNCFGGNDGGIDLTVNGGVLPYSYEWNNGNTNEDISNLLPGTYSVSISDNNGCTNSASVTIDAPDAALETSLTGTDIQCFGYHDGSISQITTGGTPPYSYQWSSGQTNSNLNNLYSGIYTVTVLDANNCAAVESIEIYDLTTEIVIVPEITDLICFGVGSGAINLSVSGGTPGYNFNWSNGAQSQDIAGINAGSYTVTITDNNGCTNTGTYFVVQPGELMVVTPPLIRICIDDTVTINAAGTGGTYPYFYQWNFGQTQNTIQVSPGVPTNYTVSITDSNGCLGNTSTTQVLLYDSLYLEISLLDDSVCIGDPVVVNANFGGGNGGPYSFLYDNEPISFPYSFVPEGPGEFMVLMEDNCNTPMVSDEANFVVLPRPEVAFLSNRLNGCEPLEVFFTEISGSANVTYSWNFGDPGSFNTDFIPNPVHVYENSGIYDVSLTLTNEYGCSNTASRSQMIEVYPLPVADFLPDPHTTSILKPDIFFENLSTHNYLNYWTFGDGDSSSIENPLHSFNQAGFYDVQLITVSYYGCVDTVLVEIFIRDEFTFYAPTAFSPNNDAVNDKFFVWGTEITSEDYFFAIYDRWGELIFSTNEYYSELPELSGWNGRVKDNKFAPSGVYTWLVIYHGKDNKRHERAGYFTLLR
ncbi:MAG: gliding motility-associated C-terminal domain-containing protein [Bacteroidales bacterium]|nr:gliding motility-associated C-terminal domain-containing protein [Bacteroidales bacterium]